MIRIIREEIKEELNCGELEKAICFIKQLTLTTLVENQSF